MQTCLFCNIDIKYREKGECIFWLSKSTITDGKDLIINDSPYSSYEVKTENFLNSNEFSYHSYFDSYGLVKRIIQIEQTFTNPNGESIGEGYTRSVVKRVGFSE